MLHSSRDEREVLWGCRRAWLRRHEGEVFRHPRRSTFGCVIRLRRVWLAIVYRVGAVSGVRYVWHEVPVPSALVITQVYGYLLCPRTGRVLVQDDDGAFRLPGGKPEPGDADLSATLVREAFEENQVRIGAVAYLGYQEVRRPRGVSYAQVRMAGVIEEFAPRAPDPDSGRVYRRLMTSLGTAPSVLGWGLPGVLQSRAAARVARLEWGLPVDAPAPPGYED